MAVKQYIGARYVPLLDGDYNPNKAYEPLTVVNFGSASYTSKKSVPAGIDPTNAEYWQQTGFGSQGVAELEAWKTQTVEPFMQQTTSDVSGLQGDVFGLQGDVSGLQGDVSGLQDGVSDLQSDTTGLQSNVSGLQGDVSNINSEIMQLHAKDADLQNQINNISPAANAERKYVFIGDSYGLGLRSNPQAQSTNGYPNLIKTIMGLTEGENFFHLSKNGAGFVATPTFLSILNELSTGMPSTVDKDTITDVVVCGGWNDTPHTGYPNMNFSIWNAVNTFVETAKSIFKNATVHIGVVAYCTSPDGGLRSRTVLLKPVSYQYSMARNASIIKDVQYVLASNPRTIEPDGNNNHPTQTGQDLIAYTIISHLLGGSVYYGGNFDSNRPTYTLASGVSLSKSGAIQVFEQKEGGMYTLAFKGLNLLFSNLSGDPSRGIPLMVLSGNIGHGIGAPYTCAPVTGNLYTTSGNYVPFTGSLGLAGNTVVLYSLTLNSAGTGFLPAANYAGIFLYDVCITMPIGWV